MSIDRMYSDLDSHHIEGIAHQGDTPFAVPLISHIVGNLWTGGCVAGVRLPLDFRHVVSLYPWERYTLGSATERVEVKLHDAAEVPDRTALYQLAGHVQGCLREGKTLVHCQAGLNRSGLVAGLALVVGGMDPADAIELLRSKRSPAVLCNRAFETWLLGQGLTPPTGQGDGP